MKTKFILLFLSLVLCACSKSDDESKKQDIHIVTDFNTTRGTATVVFDESPIPVAGMFRRDHVLLSKIRVIQINSTENIILRK